VKWISPEKIGKAFKPVYIMLSRKYWMDELYENVIVKTILYNGIFKVMAMFDSSVVDGTVNGAARGTALAGGALRKLQTGQTQLYVISIAIGAVAIAACLYLFG
jgi:NADH-quinone oxidoreductase subunit L